MDVVINSQIQSPLVRTLARTKGKSQSFTHSIPDNVPPCSFSKIVLSAQNSGETQLGRNYKIKIPQYGYLRDAILKYTVQEAPIDSTVASIAKSLYEKHNFFLDDVQIRGTYAGAVGKTSLVGGVSKVRLYDDNSNLFVSNLSWFNLQSLAQSNYVTLGTEIDPDFVNLGILAPQFKTLLAGGTNAPQLSKANTAALGAVWNGQPSVVCSDPALTSASAVMAPTSYSETGGINAAGPYTQAIKINGNPRIWASVTRFYYNLYKLNKAGQFPIATMIWEALKREPIITTTEKLYTTRGASGISSYKTNPYDDVLWGKGAQGYNATGDRLDLTNEYSVDVGVTLPRFCALRPAGGDTVWIPKMPQLIFDAQGTAVGVNFIEMNLMHPLDQADTLAGTYLMKLSTDPASASTNFRRFQISEESEDFETWDWQTESQYYNGIAANVASTISLTTHNRPIQTIYPQETYMRIQRMPQSERIRFMKMMEPQISQQGVLGDKAGEKIMYYPMLLASTENPSYNFDTRFVEQLDIDVQTKDLASIFTSSDVEAQSASSTGVWDFATWVDQFRVAVFSVYFGANQAYNSIYEVQQVMTIPQSTIDLQANLRLTGVSADPSATTAYGSFNTYTQYTPRAWVLSLRTNSPVPRNFIKVECLAYYHNFHDRTAQAIRDANFKPNTPASLLQYNTYMESERSLKLSEIRNTQQINMNITTNNLVFGTSFMIRRRALNPLLTGKSDHYMNTLPVREVTLTASGQQIYHAEFDESALTDVWDYDLATGKVGRKYNNSVLIQSRVDEKTGEELWQYYLPFSFSSDMTYNSGSIAFQTLNNPVLSLTVDMGVNSTKGYNLIAEDDDFIVQVYHNYWNMIRIDSNTGAITRSLDL